MCMLTGMTFGDPIWFAGKHRIHHKYSDTERDVHSPKQGFWFCWFGSVADEGYPEKEILKHAADFTSYPELMWMHRNYWVTPVVVGIITFLIGGFSMLAIGYGGSIIAANLKVAGVHVFSAGDFLAATAGAEEIVLSDPSFGVYKKLVIADGRLIGAVLFGDIADGPWYLELIRSRSSIERLRDDLVFGRTLALRAAA